MKILCVGDIHIKTNNTHLVDLLQDQIFNIILEKSISQVVLLGDILDTFEKIHTQAMNRAYTLIQKIAEKCEIYILVGNHDYINNQQFLSDEHWMNGLKFWKNVNIVDNVINNNNIYYVPYVPNGRFQEALNTLGKNWKKEVKIIFAHQEFQGCKMGAIESVHGDQWDEDFPIVISGHIHDYQKPQKNIIYIGSSIQNSFGDQHSPKLLIVDTILDLFEELELVLPKKKITHIELEDLKNMDIEKMLMELEEKKEIVEQTKIVVKGDCYEQYKLFMQTNKFETLLNSKYVKIAFKPNKKIKTENTPCDGKNFMEILDFEILKTYDELFFCIYQDIVYGNEINSSDILII